MNIGIIFGGGVGNRMKNKDTPKQFIEVFNKPIIIHTIDYFEQHPLVDGIIVVCLEEWIPFFNNLLKKYEIKKVMKVVPGGKTGQLSIYNGLCAAKELADEKSEDAIVIIHDAVRPLINNQVITDNIQSVLKNGNAITCSVMTEPVIVINEGKDTINYIPERRFSRVSRAPQSFWLKDILDLHERARKEGIDTFIDSCDMMHKYGKELHLIVGPEENIKITNPEDLYYLKTVFDIRSTRDS